jgi:hypothetical protein
LLCILASYPFRDFVNVINGGCKQLRLGRGTWVKKALGIALGLLWQFAGSFEASAQATAVAVSPTSVRFSSQGTGLTSTPKVVRLTNRGSAVITISQVQLLGSNASEFKVENGCSAPIVPRDSCAVSITLTPQSVGTQSASLIITTTVGSLEVALSGTSAGPKVTPSPRSVKFPKQFLETPAATRVVRISNSGKGLLPWTPPVLRGSHAGDFAIEDDCSATLQPRDACSISVAFAPLAGGERTADLVVAAGTSEETIVGLSGSAIAPTPKTKLNPTRLAFGQIGTGTTVTRSVQVTSVGDAPLRVLDAEVALDDKSNYRLEWSCDEQLQSGESCTIEVALTPDQPSDVQTNLTVITSAGTEVIPISAKTVGPSPRLSPTLLKFNKQAVGETSESRVVKLGNSGLGLLTVRAVSLRGEHASDFVISNTCGSPIAKSEGCEIGVQFVPTAAGDRTAVIDIVDNAGGRSIALSGLATAPMPKISVSPTRVGFSKQGTGTESDPRFVVLRNTGDGQLRIETVTPKGESVADFKQSNTCGDPIEAGDSCEIELVFAPEIEGGKAISLELRSNAGLLSIPVTGSAAGPSIRASPTSLRWNSLAVGESAERRVVSITNRGLGVLDIATITPTGATAADWVLSNTCGDPIASGESCEISVIWRPVAGGARSGSFVIKSNAGELAIPLSGTAVAPEAKAAVSPARLSFGSQGVGLESAPRVIAVSSKGTDALRVSTVTIVGADADQFKQGNDCGLPIESGDVCSIEMTFLPATTGDKAVEVVIRTNAGDFRIPVTGRADGPKITLTPTRLSFAAQASFSSSESRVLSLRNTGKGVFALSTISFIQNDEQSFEFDSDCPRRLDPGDTCQVSIVFRPRSAGAKTAALRVTGNTDTPDVVLTGVGRGSDLPSGKFDETRWDESTWTP